MMDSHEAPRFIEILLVEDNKDDVELTQLAFESAHVLNALHVARDGVEALHYLRREGPFAEAPRPDIILLDLNMPRMDGRELLTILKADDDFRRIPVVVLTTSYSENDVLQGYVMHANSYLTKPVRFSDFLQCARRIADYWFALVKLPPHQKGAQNAVAP